MRKRRYKAESEAGYMLLFAVVLIALVMIGLAIAAPVVARQLRRDKEVESQHRMQQYVRAIRLYYKKTHSYPPSVKALENTNNIRFLRQAYVDPLTGKADWRLIHQGEQKTKIHPFFGEELQGLTAGLGSAAGMQSNIGSPVGGSTAGGSSTSTIGSASPLASGFLGASSTTGTSGTSGATGTSGSSGGTSAFGDGTGGIIVGVGTAKSGDSITNPNQQGTYETWEFWYDPNIELLYQLGQQGGVSSTSASGFGGSVPGATTPGTGGLGGPSTPGGGGTTGTPTTPANPFQ